MSVEAELLESVSYTPLQRMRHSAAHVMAEAVQEIFPDARFAIGPAIEDGFYYDFDLPRALTPDDLPEIEKRMARIVAGKYPFKRDRWAREKKICRMPRWGSTSRTISWTCAVDHTWKIRDRSVRSN